MKIDKRYIVLVVGLIAVTTQAQTVTNAQWARDGRTLTINYNLIPQEVKTDYAYIVTPMLCTQNDTLLLEPQIWRGANNARKLHRQVVLQGGTEGSYALAKSNETVSRQQEFRLADYPWLHDAPLSLTFRQEREGCCKVEDLGVVREPLPAYKRMLVPKLSVIKDFEGRAGELKDDNPVIAHISKYRPYDRTRILRKEEGMLVVHYELAKSDLREDFGNNKPILDRIVTLTREIMNDETSNVRIVQIVGLASVEGNTAKNEQLALDRANALKRYVQARVNVPDSLFEVNNGGEAWAELRDQINDAQFEGYERSLNVIDETEDAAQRERKLRALPTYRYVRDNLLQDQRNAGYLRIFYDYAPDKQAATINRASQLMMLERYQDALELLNTVRDDIRAENALGCALYMTGHEAEGMEYFRRAAARGNEDAIENLRQLTQ